MLSLLAVLRRGDSDWLEQTVSSAESGVGEGHSQPTWRAMDVTGQPFTYLSPCSVLVNVPR